MVDQRKLPADEIYVTCKNVNDVAKAIKTMVIRGAPAIGVCAAMGLPLDLARSSVRLTLGWPTTEAEVDEAVGMITAGVERLAGRSGRRVATGS